MYRVKFSQNEKQRVEIMGRLQACNDKLKTILQISDDNHRLVQERASNASRGDTSICRFWRQAGKVFSALSTVWNCSCRAQHSTGLLLEHRTGSTNDFHLLYEKDLQRPRELRKIRISSNEAEYEDSAAIRFSSVEATGSNAQVATRTDPNHRLLKPQRSAMKTRASSNGAPR